MRAVSVGADRALHLAELPDPMPGPGQALVKVAYCGICGSDLHMRPRPEFFPDGTVPGHELSGRIVALGPGGGVGADAAAGGRVWTVGDRVTVLPFGQCGECELCLSGNEQACPRGVPNGIGLGSGRAGGYADTVVVDQRMLFRLPDALGDREAALVEPTAVALRGLAAAAAPLDAHLAVLGAGIIGVLTALLLRARGYRSFALVSRNRARGERAAALGLPVISEIEFAERAGASPPSHVIDCAGTPSSAEAAVVALAPLGRLVLVGLSLEPLVLPAPLIVLKELQIRGAIAYRRGEFAEAIALLAGGAIPAARLITSEVPLERAAASFQELDRPNGQLKVLLRP
jgi:(R,R)-butanediol dehydrogenase / meso-butanediol dehydrogenase / diacetyl reductase